MLPQLNIPSQADRQKRIADSQSGHASMNYQKSLRQDVPAGTNIVVCAFTVAALVTDLPALAAMKAVSGVGTGKVVASGTVPPNAPEGVYGEGTWELTVDAGLRGYTAQPVVEPEPE